ncbi:PQQ-binding-like beta-propeller repeat protein [Shivajiella indica]|uniref:PQQ-binding-like beta-propeller repeat protein n=1 Tax=Shivajiella indica TaxID=872115 RepID=A0ABW5B4R1_9BACT
MKWTVDFPVIGSQSSPRTTDLNGDGVLDIVIGAGKNEFQPSDQGILALNGLNGEILWQHEAEDQVYGSATFVDINQDNIQDVIIGGRTPQLSALDGRSGKLLWKYAYSFEDHPILQYAKFNFNNSVWIPDQNGDGIADILTVNGGNAEAKPFEEENRYPGVLMLIDSRTGNILASDTMPDGKESYMSPLAFSIPNRKETFILFGSGGETLSGNLYLGNLEDLKSQKLKQSKVIASESGHGFISPPVLADINLDGILDIIAISHSSTLFAIDGSTHELLWKNKIEGTECSNSFAVGYFNKDNIPDFFTFVSKGIWPENTGLLQVMVSGKDGNIEYLDSLGCAGFSSPVSYDLNHDGIDEVLISINEYDCDRKITDQSSFPIENKLLAIDFKNQKIWPIDQSQSMKNIFSTPWIGDLDSDGYLDIVHFQYFSHSDILSFLGMRAKRIDTSVKIKKDILWGAYMGSNGDGIFKNYK